MNTLIVFPPIVIIEKCKIKIEGSLVGPLDQKIPPFQYRSRGWPKSGQRPLTGKKTTIHPLERMSAKAHRPLILCNLRRHTIVYFVRKSFRTWSCRTLEDLLGPLRELVSQWVGW